MKALKRGPVGTSSSARAGGDGSSMPTKKPPASAAPPHSKPRRDTPTPATTVGSGSRRMLDPLADRDIGAAAAEIAGHRGVDGRIVRLRVSGEQSGSGHDLPRL